MAGSPKLPPAGDALVTPLLFDNQGRPEQNDKRRPYSSTQRIAPQLLAQISQQSVPHKRTADGNAALPTHGVAAYLARTKIADRAPGAYQGTAPRIDDAPQPFAYRQQLRGDQPVQPGAHQGFKSPQAAQNVLQWIESRPEKAQPPSIKDKDATLLEAPPAPSTTKSALPTGLPPPPFVFNRANDNAHDWAPGLPHLQASRFTSSRRLAASALSSVGTYIDLLQTDSTRAPLNFKPVSLHNLTPGQQALQKRLLTKQSIEIPVCGSGYTALSTIAYTFLTARGENRSTLHPDVPGQREIHIKLISPNGLIGGLAYTPGTGALEDPASTTNTPASHLEIQIFGFQFKDYFDYRIKNAKSDEERTYFAGLKATNYDSQAGRPGPFANLDTLYHNYSAKNKTNTRSAWKGQVQRGNDGVLRYMKWVRSRLAQINVFIDEVPGEVVSYETKDGQPIFKYRDAGGKITEMAGDVAIMAGGQGPLKAAPAQMNSLEETQKLSWDGMIEDAHRALTAIKTGTDSEATAAMKAFGQKYLGKQLLVIGTGIAAEEVQPAMDAVVQAYETRRSTSAGTLPPLPQQNGGVKYISRNAYIHELSQNERGALRYARLKNETGEARFTKIATKGELEYREDLIEIFRKGSTANASHEFGKLLADMNGDPARRFMLVQALTRLARDISSGLSSAYDEHVEVDPFMEWREDIEECMLTINRDHNSAIETVAVPTRNENVDRFKREREMGNLYAVGNDYKFVAREDGKFVLEYEGKQDGPFDAALNATGRSNYGLDASSVHMPKETSTVGSATDPALQSYEVEPGFWLANSKGGIHPLVVLTPALIQREVMMGSQSIHGAPGAVAAFGVSAKISGQRAKEAGEVLGQILFPDARDALDSLPIVGTTSRRWHTA